MTSTRSLPKPGRPAILSAVVVVVFVVIYLTSSQSAGALLFGVASGALVSAIALGVVLTYKGSGVVNFASGAIAMYASYVFMDLRTQGKIFIPPLPIPHFPKFVPLGNPWSFWPALLLTLVFSAVIGLLLHFLVFGPIRHAPALAKVVASVGILVVLQAVVVQRFGTSPFSVPSQLPKKLVTLPRNIQVPEDQILAVIIVLVATVALWALYRFTRFGIASRASAENEKSVVLLGHAPNRLAAGSWVLSSTLVGLVGVLVSTVNTSVDPTSIVLLVVPALAAALIGGFTSFGLTVAAGIAISMGEGLVQNWSLQPWFPKISGAPIPGLDQFVPVILIIVVLIARGSTIPTRATVGALKMPISPRPGSTRDIAVKAALVGVLAVVLLLTTGPDWRLGITSTAIYATLAMSLVVVTGFVGQISLAQLTLAGAAGFALSKAAVNLGMPFPLAPVVAVLFGTLIGVIISTVSIRVRGVDLAIVTLALAVAAEDIIFANPKLAGSSFGATVPAPKLGAAHFGPGDSTAWSLVHFTGDGKQPNPWFGVFCVIVALVMACVVLNFRRSRSGRLSLAVRSNERATAAAGVSVTRVKMVAFTVGAFLAATAGVLAGYSSGSVSSTTFGSFASLNLLVYAYLGGIASLGGALAAGTIAGGGLAAVAMTTWLHIDNSYLLLIGGVGLVITVVLNPEGIAGETQRSVNRLTSRLTRLAGRSPAVAVVGAGSRLTPSVATPGRPVAAESGLHLADSGSAAPSGGAPAEPAEPARVGSTEGFEKGSVE
jgi:branched-chain amino acid transport system permease protein